MKIENIQEKVFQVIDGDFLKSSEWNQAVIDGDGYFEKNCFITFRIGDFEVNVDFLICLSGEVYVESGDYFNPPFTDVDLNKVVTIVNNVTSENNDVVFTENDLNIIKERVLQSI